MTWLTITLLGSTTFAPKYVWPKNPNPNAQGFQTDDIFRASIQIPRYCIFVTVVVLISKIKKIFFTSVFFLFLFYSLFFFFWEQDLVVASVYYLPAPHFCYSYWSVAVLGGLTLIPTLSGKTTEYRW